MDANTAADVRALALGGGAQASLVIAMIMPASTQTTIATWVQNQ
jgi:hypothetical protein